jgi:pilus assembly protein CpaB
MATRFGGNPSYAYSVKLRYVVGALVAVVVVLLMLLVGVMTMRGGSDTPQPQAGALAPQQPVSVSSKVDVLIAQSRIEAGTQLKKGLFVTRQWEPDQIPEGAVRASEEHLILEKFAKDMVPANMPILKESITEQPPLSTLTIPAGFRAVTIQVDSRSGVEGFAKPGSRVDVLFSFKDKDTKQKVATLARFIKVLSMGGIVGGGENQGARMAIAGRVDVTLLVTERDAKRIELARNVGTLSLALVGGEEQGRPSAEDPQSVDLSDLTGTRDAAPEEEPAQGYMYMRDPKTGRQMKFKLKGGGKWEKDKEEIE